MKQFRIYISPQIPHAIEKMTSLIKAYQDEGFSVADNTVYHEEEQAEQVRKIFDRIILGAE